ncbi:MAG: hypothetical protein QXG46_05500 [Ignisphaera sp.]
MKKNEEILLFCVNIDCIEDMIKKLIDLYRVELYNYNNIAKRYGIYLKPVHIAVKRYRNGTKVYHYYGRYWYKIMYSEGRLVWTYIGKEKPLNELPDPPLNPFMVVKVLRSEDREKACVYVDNRYSLQSICRYFVSALESSATCSDLDKRIVLSNSVAEC